MNEDFPEELRRQLSKIPQKDSLAWQVLTVMRGQDVMSLDEIIIAIWRKSGKVSKRRCVHTRMQMLSDTGHVERVMRGFYKLPKVPS